MVMETNNYKFQKPSDDDFYDIKVQNRNWDKNDTALKDLDNQKVAQIGGDISKTIVEGLDEIEEKFPMPAAGEKTKAFLSKVKKSLEDWKNFKDGIITLGRLVNNGLTTEPGFALDARYGKALQDQIAQLNDEVLDVRLVTNRKAMAMADDTDYDTLIQPGWYDMYSTDTAATHAPADNVGRILLRVDSVNISHDYNWIAIQTAIEWHSPSIILPKVYKRWITLKNNTYIWTPWIQSP